jgi:hypothetical protein
VEIFPGAEYVPWRPADDAGNPTYYAGLCEPDALVIHRLEGYATTARQWARDGHFGASWTWTVLGRSPTDPTGINDGKVLQHLDLHDGGYHAGLSDAQAAAAPPTWPRWRGRWGGSINLYTLGVEAEGFSGQPLTEKQLIAIRSIAVWCARRFGWPWEPDRFPPHAEIDRWNRVNDFNTPELRHQLYDFMFREDLMGADIRDGVDVGAIRIPLEGAAVKRRDARLLRQQADALEAWAEQLEIQAHKLAGGDGDLIRGK